MEIKNSYNKITVSKERAYDIDWIRFIVIVLLIPYHAAMVFGLAPFHIKNNITYLGFNLFNEILGTWNISVLFLIAGLSSGYSLLKRSVYSFIKERFNKLIIPLVFSILFLIPIQTYYQRLQERKIGPGYLNFLSHLFNGIYPKGNLTWNHLWFIAYLFVISVGLVNFCIWLKKHEHALMAEKLTAFFQHKFAIFLMALPIITIEYLLRSKYPNGNQNLINDWANILDFILIYLYGYIFSLSSAQWYKAIMDSCNIALFLALFGTAFYLYKSNMLREYGIYSQTIDVNFLNACRGFNSWCFIIAVLGLARKFLTFSNNILVYGTAAFYPIYIIHQTVLIFGGYYIVQINISTGYKFILLVVFTYFGTLLIYHAFAKTSSLGRTVFGLNKIR